MTRKPPLCSRCLVRGDYVPLRVGHMCLAEACGACGALRVAKVVDWSERRGFMTVLEPCQSCAYAAFRGFE